ncbi:hypothetical protein ABLW17_10745, partial [Anaerococcus murdochii]
LLRINAVVIAHYSYWFIDRSTKLKASSQRQPSHADDIYTVAHWALTETILIDAFKDNFVRWTFNQHDFFGEHQA